MLPDSGEYGYGFTLEGLQPIAFTQPEPLSIFRCHGQHDLHFLYVVRISISGYVARYIFQVH